VSCSTIKSPTRKEVTLNDATRATPLAGAQQSRLKVPGWHLARDSFDQLNTAERRPHAQPSAPVQPPWIQLRHAATRSGQLPLARKHTFIRIRDNKMSAVTRGNLPTHCARKPIRLPGRNSKLNEGNSPLNKMSAISCSHVISNICNKECFTFKIHA
jgi:hypothetical protein